jgi:hypothetical protein
MPATDPATGPLASLREHGLLSRRLAAMLGGLLLLELLLVVAYLAVSGAGVTAPRYLAYPFVWVNLSLLAVTAVGRTLGDVPTSRRTDAAAWLVGAGYLLLLLWAGGLVGLDGGGGGLRVLAAPPGWGPLVVYDGTPLHLAVVPFKLVGYLALAWLVAVVVRATGRPLVAGSLGLVTCVGCTGPLVLAVVTAVFGGSATAFAAVAPLSYDLSTLVFVVAVGGLVASAFRLD